MRADGVAQLDVVGLMWIDFSGEMFPFRAEIVRTDTESVALTGYVGQVDERTGKVPRLPSGTLIVPVRGAPELIVGRRQVPIVWTKVLAWCTPGSVD